MEISKYANKIKRFLQKHPFVLICFVVLISYGQILQMHVWQDDNALFFKLGHIADRAGYLGYGPFGQGAYKYTATPYIPIYQLFGYENVYYFLLALVSYMFSTYVLYRAFSSLITKKAGLIVAFLYACGYVASDGYIRLFNTVITSASIAFVSIFLFTLFKYKETHKSKWYIAGVLLFFFALEFARARTHYLIAIPILFELLFFASRNIRKNLYLLLRLVPFLVIFYYYFVLNSDARSGEVKIFMGSLLRGQFYNTFSFFTTISNLFIPDWFVLLLNRGQQFLLTKGVPYFPFIELVIFSLFGITYLVTKQKKSIIGIYSVFGLGWFFLSRILFQVPLLPQDPVTLSKLYIGGLVLFSFALLTFFVPQKWKKLYVLLLGWVVINIAAYSAYFPTVTYETVNRYLAHSFFALVGLLSILFYSFDSKFVKLVILLWGIGNLVQAFSYQQSIVRTRSDPPRAFYSQLKQYVPKIEKGEVFYFDVAENARRYFSDAFSVAQMPDTTAIAWRYNLDRYDFEMATEFQNLIAIINEKNIGTDKVHTFFYTTDGLIDTSLATRALLENQVTQSFPVQVEEKSQVTIIGNNVTINPITLTTSLPNVTLNTPIEISATIEAHALGINEIPLFPTYFNSRIGSTLSEEQKSQALDYLQFIRDFRNTAKIDTTSSWQERIKANLIDGDTNTVWQPDRLLWHEGQEAITIALTRTLSVSAIVWQNGFGNNTPTEYTVFTSMDSVDWQEAISIKDNRRIDIPEPQIVPFEKREAKYVKIIYKNSLNDDAPGISEVWVLPSIYSGLNLSEAKKYAENPLAMTLSAIEYMNVLKKMNYIGNVRVYWKTNKYSSIQTNDLLILAIKYDGLAHIYKFKLPAGGQEIEELRLIGEQIPGSLRITNISVSPAFDK